MKDKTLTLSSKGQITLPKSARTQLGLNEGAKLRIKEVTNDTITLEREYTVDDIYGQTPNLWNGQDPVATVRNLRDNDRA